MCVAKEEPREIFLSPGGTACSRLTSRIRRQTCRPSGTPTASNGVSLSYTHPAPTERKTGVLLAFCVLHVIPDVCVMITLSLLFQAVDGLSGFVFEGFIRCDILVNIEPVFLVSGHVRVDHLLNLDHLTGSFFD